MKILVAFVIVIICALVIRLIVKGGVLGKIGSAVVGVVGSIIGNLICIELGLNTEFDWFGMLLASILGALCMLFLVNRFLSKLR
jgi:uncharacterized membrane protein YeaQ/YmgE (transglycosylase-associated protein family)